MSEVEKVEEPAEPMTPYRTKVYEQYVQANELSWRRYWTLNTHPNPPAPAVFPKVIEAQIDHYSNPLARVHWAWQKLKHSALSPFGFAAVAKETPKVIWEKLVDQPGVRISYCSVTCLPVVYISPPLWDLLSAKDPFRDCYSSAKGDIVSLIDKYTQGWDPEDEENRNFFILPEKKSRCQMTKRDYGILRKAYLLKKIPNGCF